MRGAAPWAVRHAQKHADEVAARNREPPKPGSARATLRVPDQAERIKERVGQLHQALIAIRALRKDLNASFFELAKQLGQLKQDRLYEAKGYASFEAFVEREVDLGRALAQKLLRVPEVFVEAEARRYGLNATFAALDTLEQHHGAAPERRGPQRPQKPLKPPA